jgi:hypothetical protein
MLQPVKWKSGRKTDFRLWLQKQIKDTVSDRRPLEKRWKHAIEDWRAKLPDGTLEFPFVGASNVIFPLTAIHSDPVYSDFMATFHASPHFWNTSPRNESNIEKANSLREALRYINEDFLKLRDVNRVGFLYNVVLGSAVYKDHWMDKSHMKMSYDPTGKARLVAKKVSRPAIQHVPLQHFYFPANAVSLDPDHPVAPAQWCAQKFWLTKAQIKAKVVEDGDLLPGYDKKEVDHVFNFDRTKEEPTDEVIQDEGDLNPFEDLKIDLFEVWVRYDADGDGIEEDIVVIYHEPTMSILRATYNPFRHGQRPFEILNYLPTFGPYGMGVAEVNQWAQYTLTKMLNAQVDNALLANTRMFGFPSGSNILPDEPIYPGRQFALGPNEQIQEIRLSDTYPSLPQSMFSFLQWAEQRTGVSELRQGNITGLPDRTPASTVLSILREGNKRFDMIISNMREPFTRMGLRLIQNFAQFAKDTPAEQEWMNYFISVMGEEQALQIFEIIQLSPEEIQREFGITTSATSALANQEVEKQSFVAVLQLVSQIYPQLLQTAQLIDQLPPGTTSHETAVSSYVGGIELLQRLLERFEIQNPEMYIPNMQVALQSQMQQGAGMAPPGAGGPVSPLPAAIPPDFGGAGFF